MALSPMIATPRLIEVTTRRATKLTHPKRNA
jgi:hypothetical protein